MSARNLGSSDKALYALLSDMKERIRRLERRRPVGTGEGSGGGETICDCEDGEPGADGSTILSGSGAPSASLGTDGDFYIDTATFTIYGPRTSGAWGAGTVLPGDDGDDSTVPGPPGDDGAPGTDGTDGLPGGGITWTQEYDSSSTANSDPGNGLFRFNNATQGSATALYCDDLDNLATNIRGIISEIAFSSSSSLGHLRLVRRDDPTDWIFFTVTARALLTGYSSITVTFETQSGVNPFADGDIVHFFFTAVGDQGDQGDPGDPGAPGTGPPIFANNAARDAAIVSPAFGEQCFVTVDSTGEGSMQIYDGTGWLAEDVDWVSFTPSLNNITLGSGTRFGRYMRMRRRVKVHFAFEFGSGSSVGTNPGFDLPFAGLDPNGALTLDIVGLGNIADSGTANNILVARPTNFTGSVFADILFQYLNAASTAALSATITSSVPIAAWATNDRFDVIVEYDLDDEYE